MDNIRFASFLVFSHNFDTINIFVIIADVYTLIKVRVAKAPQD